MPQTRMGAMKSMLCVKSAFILRSIIIDFNQPSCLYQLYGRGASYLLARAFAPGSIYGSILFVLARQVPGSWSLAMARLSCGTEHTSDVEADWRSFQRFGSSGLHGRIRDVALSLFVGRNRRPTDGPSIVSCPLP